MKTAFLFPGQGSQIEGMLHNLVADDASSKSLLTEAEEILHSPVLNFDKADKLSSTVYAQICLLIAGVISAKQAIGQNVRPDFVAGHSVGAFAAAVICGVLSFRQALELVHERGILMQQSYPSGYGMAALTGLRESAVRRYISIHNETNEKIYLANVNSINQQVVAGKLQSIQVFLNTVQHTNAVKTKILAVSVPSHCELLDGASRSLKEKIGALALLQPDIPYASNHTGRLLRTMEEIRDDLWISVARTVRWHDATSLLHELGTGIFIEVHPAGILTKLAEESFPDARAIALNNANSGNIGVIWNNMQTTALH